MGRGLIGCGTTNWGVTGMVGVLGRGVVDGVAGIVFPGMVLPGFPGFEGLTGLVPGTP